MNNPILFFVIFFAVVYAVAYFSEPEPAKVEKYDLTLDHDEE